MHFKPVRALLCAALCLLFALPAGAVQVDCDGVWCFGAGDFSQEPLDGICITGLPAASVGTVLLGDRVLRPGDILTADQIGAMTFCPVWTEEDTEVSVSYLPIAAGQVGPGAVMTISIRGKENQAPVAEDFAAETYKNLPLEGTLKVKDPEGEAMTFTLVRGPKRGQVELKADGSFVYTPRKNKVGIDSFVYTATDAAGKTSREATVTVTIVKPTDSTQYTDTLGRDCRFAAEWMKNTGIFVAEKLDGNPCFSPDKTVSQGEFLTMLVRTLDIPLEDPQTLAVCRKAPEWLKPYLAAAVRSGLAAGVALTPDCSTAITGAEAALMLQNALDLTAAAETAAPEGSQTPAAGALNILRDHGIRLTGEALTRSEAAMALYRAAQLAQEAPGMLVIAAQR